MHTQIIRPPAFQRPSGGMYVTGITDLTNGSYVLMTFDTIISGFNDGIEDVVNHWIKPGVAGYYSIAARISFQNVVADKTYIGDLRVSGVSKETAYWHAATTTFLGGRIVVPVFYLTATDYLTLYAMSNSGDNTVDVNKAKLWVQRVR